MKIETFFDQRTSTLTYVVYDEESKDAIVIDPVLDYDAAASRTWTESVDRVIERLRAQGLRLHYVLETHAHADHLSGSQRLKEACPNTQVAIGDKITTVQKTFKKIFDLPEDFPTDGSQFDRLLQDGDVIEAGTLRIETIHTPGHTPACVSYRIGDAVFTGDALFMPDSGTGRCDFPAGSAHDLYRSVTQRLYNLPESTRVFVGHDYQPGGREMRFESTIGEEKANNIVLPADRDEADFVAFRQQRDAGLNAPKLLLQSVQINVNAGSLPEPSDNEVRYLKIPINIFRTQDDPPAAQIEACPPPAPKPHNAGAEEAAN